MSTSAAQEESEVCCIQTDAAVTRSPKSKQLLLFAFVMSKANSSNCLLEKWAVTAVCIYTEIGVTTTSGIWRHQAV